jgi:hypothetical protein
MFWKNEMNLEYVYELETRLADTFTPTLYKKRESDQRYNILTVTSFFNIIILVVMESI